MLSCLMISAYESICCLHWSSRASDNLYATISVQNVTHPPASLYGHARTIIFDVNTYYTSYKLNDKLTCDKTRACLRVKETHSHARHIA